MPQPKASMKHAIFASRTFPLAVLAAGALFIAAGASIAAPSQRTFVAFSGSDANPDCSRTLPCRTFKAAIAQTNPGGEVVILDTAGYGPMVIDKSIKIIGPSGVYGGISVIGGPGGPGLPPPPTTGIVINAGDIDVITLRGLDISGVPGAPPLPLIGIDIQNAGVVHIEKSSISNFTQDASACISLTTSKPVQVYIDDSFLRECRDGIFVEGSGLDDTMRARIIIDNTRIERMISMEAPFETNAIRLVDAFVATVRNSVLVGAARDGINASNAITTVRSRVYVANTQISSTGFAALETTGAPTASLQLNVANSLITQNATGLRHGHGQAVFVSSVVANNGNSLVDCGGGAASVSSLGYGAGIGSNAIYANTDAGVPGGCTAYITPTLFVGK